MKPHYSTAPQSVRDRIEAARRNTIFPSPNGDIPIAALGTLNALRTAVRYGYNYPPADIATPAHDAVAAAEGERAGRLRTELSCELQFERQAKVESEGLQLRWANEPSATEQSAQAKAEREAAEREAAIVARTEEILAKAEVERTERNRTTARKQAAKELAP